jgi:hypothetical protein
MSLALYSRPSAARLRRTAVAMATALGAVGAAQAALPPFSVDPAAVGLAGSAFTADNLLVSNYSTVTLDSGGAFTESGFLSVSAAQLGGSTFTPAGLNSAYGVYIAFTGSGTVSVGDLGQVPTFGTLTSLSYTMYGYNGSAVFDFSGNTPTESATGEVILASGSLLNGNVVTVPTGDGGGFTPSANAKLSFVVQAPAFFQDPAMFYDVAMTSFSNTSSQVESFAGGFRIRQGGGSINFAATPVPEPTTYLMLLAGLGAVGFVARRRNRQNA